MRRFSEFVANTMRVPKDAVMDLPRLSVCGDREIYIENHKGLAEYTDTDIRVKMRDGIMHISGKELRIIVMKYGSIVINGIFGAVIYENNGDKYKKC
ncbi:MAG: sporulation protein YqfC [Clostridia bacterium]|nr:sporulation protein YqfC [Clostridia bacterium]